MSTTSPQRVHADRDPHSLSNIAPPSCRTAGTGRWRGTVLVRFDRVHFGRGRNRAGPESPTVARRGLRQGVAVTPIQMLQAYNTIANDGIAVDPVLVLDDIDAAASRRVIEPATASQMMTMLREVVENVDGTGRRAAVAGFDVVGKTGTAWQPCGENGVGYECADERRRHYTPSFAGIVSNDDGPQFTVLVMLDNPRGEHYGGGSVAAPVFAEIVAYTAQQPGCSDGASRVPRRSSSGYLCRSGCR